LSFKKLNDDIHIEYDIRYSKSRFFNLFSYKLSTYKISNNTVVFNNDFLPGASFNNINNKAFINSFRYIKNNGTISHLYSKKALNTYLKNKKIGRLAHGEFRKKNVKLLKHIINLNKLVDTTGKFK